MHCANTITQYFSNLVSFPLRILRQTLKAIDTKMALDGNGDAPGCNKEFYSPRQIHLLAFGKFSFRKPSNFKGTDTFSIHDLVPFYLFLHAQVNYANHKPLDLHLRRAWRPVRVIFQPETKVLIDFAILIFFLVFLTFFHINNCIY